MGKRSTLTNGRVASRAYADRRRPGESAFSGAVDGEPQQSDGQYGPHFPPLLPCGWCPCAA